MKRTSLLLLAAWLTAVVATGCALFIGEVMGMAPCVLCWYQRIAMFPLALVLGMAFYSDDRRGAVYALPLAIAGAVPQPSGCRPGSQGMGSMRCRSVLRRSEARLFLWH